MKILIKIGGTLLDQPDKRAAICDQIAAIHRGHTVVVVHGGGKQVTNFLAARGIASSFIGGLRVTTPETLDAVLKVLAGSVNCELVAALQKSGTRAVGLTGLDGNLVEAVEMSAALGAVGWVARVHPELLELLTARGYIPVVGCVAGDGKGRIFNINGDTMASACAAALRVEVLIFLTDVAGVLTGGSEVLERLTVSGAGQLIAGGVASGGMQAKLAAASDAVRAGVRQVHIVPGAADRILERILNGEPAGTRLEAA